MKQTTILSPVEFKSAGLHSGKIITIRILPAIENSGIVFRRVDKQIDINLSFENLSEDLLRRTCIKKDGVEVNTIEHLMVVFMLVGLDNAIVEIDAEEVPGMDGSSVEFYNAIKSTGLKEQNAERKYLVIDKPIYFEKDKSTIIGLPYDGFKVSYTLDYDAEEIGSMHYEIDASDDKKIQEMLSARTFCLQKEADYLVSKGYGKGANKENTCIVCADKKPLGGDFRFPRELAAHKTLDLIGDLFVAGFIKGSIIAIRGGHSVNAGFVKKLMSDK